MSEIPFGFGKPGDPNDPGSRGPGGGGMGFGDLGGGDISDALHRFADMLSWQGGPGELGPRQGCRAASRGG